jgi:flagellar secretion chaperone FliS
MRDNPYATSLETRIVSATPMELVVILYDAAIEAVQSAREHLAHRRIAERSTEVSRAVAILTELYQSLDRKRGGELSERLAALYDYMQRVLLEANFRQSDEGLAEAQRLLATLRESWLQAAGTADQSPGWLPAAMEREGAATYQRSL